MRIGRESGNEMQLAQLQGEEMTKSPMTRRAEFNGNAIRNNSWFGFTGMWTMPLKINMGPGANVVPDSPERRCAAPSLHRHLKFLMRPACRGGMK